MDVILYKNISPPNTVNKKNQNNKFIQNESQGNKIENVRFFENGALDILNPTLLINFSTEVSDIVQYNYVKIPKFDRYYYIDKISTEGGLFRIECKVDVLMSHKADILASEQYVTRQQNKNNSPYLMDDLLPIRSDHNYFAKPFGRNVDDRTCGRIILATTGKGGTIV